MRPQDPRHDLFKSLVLGKQRVLSGDWRIEHIGFGTHMFVDAKTGDAVPMTSVTLASREPINQDYQ